MRKRIIDTLDVTIEALIDGSAGGIFYYLTNIAVGYSDSDLANILGDTNISLEYYLNYSGNKKVSNLFEYSIKNYDDNYANGAQLPLTVMSNVIYGKYRNKWKRIVEVFKNEYNINEEFVHNKIFTANNKDTIKKITITDGSTSEKTKITNTESITDDNSYYGFNSSNAVPREKDVISTTNTTQGNLDDNSRVLSNMENTDGSKDIKKNEDEKLSGRNKPMQDLLDRELEFRKKLLWNVIFDDIDTVLTIGMY